MDIFLNELIHFYSNDATNRHHFHFTQYAVLPNSIEIVMLSQITVTSLHPMYKINGLPYLFYFIASLRSSARKLCKFLANVNSNYMLSPVRLSVCRLSSC